MTESQYLLSSSAQTQKTSTEASLVENCYQYQSECASFTNTVSNDDYDSDKVYSSLIDCFESILLYCGHLLSLSFRDKLSILIGKCLLCITKGVLCTLYEDRKVTRSQAELIRLSPFLQKSILRLGLSELQTPRQDNTVGINLVVLKRASEVCMNHPYTSEIAVRSLLTVGLLMNPCSVSVYSNASIKEIGQKAIDAQSFRKMETQNEHHMYINKNIQLVDMPPVAPALQKDSSITIEESRKDGNSPNERLSVDQKLIDNDIIAADNNVDSVDSDEDNEDEVSSEQRSAASDKKQVNADDSENNSENDSDSSDDESLPDINVEAEPDYN